MSRASTPTVVLTFGSSVLQGPESIPIAVVEIYRHYRNGERVISVVPALEHVTDTLCAPGSTLVDNSHPGALAALVSTGEIESAAQLTLALHSAGIPAQFVDPREIAITAVVDLDNTVPKRLALEQLNARFERTAVLVIPDFFARCEKSGPSLLGRGGSDFTALYLAAVLGAKCRLLKDVDGLYEAGPGRHRVRPGLFLLADYATAEASAGSVVHANAVRFARDRALVLDVARVGSTRQTRIGEGPTIVCEVPTPRRVRVALLGLGHVGGGVFEYLNHFPDRFEVVAALVRSPMKYRAKGVPHSILMDSPAQVFARDPDVLVEALPGVEPARTCITRALNTSMHVVTANKALLASDWDRLAPRLTGPRRQIRYSAAVGGSVPMVEAIERLNLQSRVVFLRGILNGTCNFVLDQCARGDSFEKAVQRAQREGFAEADPTEDVSGRDAARKMEILGRVAFGGVPECVEITGLKTDCYPIPATLGQGPTRLVAEAQATPTGFTYRIGPRVLALTDFLADTHGAGNGLEIVMSDGRVLTLRGLGAGGVPTATAMFTDLLEHVSVIEAAELDRGATNCA
jgi:homoserine dehydrogenase